MYKIHCVQTESTISFVIAASYWHAIDLCQGPWRSFCRHPITENPLSLSAWTLPYQYTKYLLSFQPPTFITTSSTLEHKKGGDTYKNKIKKHYCIYYNVYISFALFWVDSRLLTLLNSSNYSFCTIFFFPLLHHLLPDLNAHLFCKLSAERTVCPGNNHATPTASHGFGSYAIA